MIPRRFTGTARLFGEAGFARLAGAHVAVVGIGGVGSWAAEALARCGVGRLTLVDGDHLAESNLNRQVHAIDSTLGQAKVEAMAARIAAIAPHCAVEPVDAFVEAGDPLAAVPAGAGVVIDAIDAPRAKAALVAACLARRQPIVVCGAAGGRTDPLRLRSDDLALTRGDALLSSVRARLRREHGLPREAGRRFRVTAVYSDEPARAAEPCAIEGELPVPGVGGAPLACAGYGSVVTVTAAMGLAAAAIAMRALGR